MIKAGKCVHFTGVQNGTCREGISYDTIPRPIACIFAAGRQANPDFCPKYREPTAEEIAADQAEREALMARFRLAMQVVAKWKTWTKTNRVAKQEVVECPACKGRLHLSQAAYNGHVWGKCETPKCVEWMQ